MTAWAFGPGTLGDVLLDDLEIRIQFTLINALLSWVSVNAVYVPVVFAEVTELSW